MKCPTEEDMHAIFEKAVTKGIPVYLVEDAGRYVIVQLIGGFITFI